MAMNFKSKPDTDFKDIDETGFVMVGENPGSKLGVKHINEDELADMLDRSSKPGNG